VVKIPRIIITRITNKYPKLIRKSVAAPLSFGEFPMGSGGDEVKTNAGIKNRQVT
jgi:hypothetical protein